MLFETKSALGNHAAIHASPHGRPAGRLRGPWAHLVAQVMRLGGDQGALVSHAERAWASATFSGSRHTIVLSFRGERAVEAGEMLVAQVSEHEFEIPGQLVADAAAIAVDHTLLPHEELTVTLEMLLLEDI